MINKVENRSYAEVHFQHQYVNILSQSPNNPPVENISQKCSRGPSSLHPRPPFDHHTDIQRNTATTKHFDKILPEMFTPQTVQQWVQTRITEPQQHSDLKGK